VEEQRHLASAYSRSFHVETLPRQNHFYVARHIGSLDSADGNYLFPAACSPISTFRTGAYFLGTASHLHERIGLLGRLKLMRRWRWLSPATLKRHIVEAWKRREISGFVSLI
jgi:hypothetical protein